jgi:hypothetical protein
VVLISPATEKYEFNCVTRSDLECLVLGNRLKWQKFIVRNSGRLKRKHAYALKPFDSVANSCSFVPSSGEKFSNMDFCVCDMIVVHTICFLWMIVRLDGFEISSVGRFYVVCHVKRQA